MHPLEEKDSSPLEDIEITRLIKVSREVGYKKQDKIPERNLVDFKPTSISQIANSKDNRQQIHRPDHDQSSTTHEKKELENSQKEIDYNSSNNGDKQDFDIEKGIRNSPQGKQKEDISDDSPKDSLDMSGVSDEENKIVEEAVNQHNEESETILADTSPNEKTIGEGTPDISPDSPSTYVKDVKQEGIEIGKKIALAELANEQQKVLESFRLVIDKIREKEIIDKTELSQSILEAITRLASERAGREIDENSETFKNKIVSFVERIEKASKKLVLKLNPKDASIIEESLLRSFDGDEFEIRGSPELFRGDFILQMGSVEVGDLISEQISIKQENGTKASEQEEMQIDANEQHKTEIISENTAAKDDTKDIHTSSGDEIDK